MTKTKQSKELGQRIRDVRKSQNLDEPPTQEAFAKKLGAARSQVSAWEAGRQRPSKEKLIALGNLATYPHNLRFWEEAGVAPAAFEAAIRRTLQQRRSEPALAEATPIARLDASALLRRLNPKEEIVEADPVDTVPFPSLFVPDRASTVCVEVTKRTKGPLLFGGDLALVQLSELPLIKLRNRLVAVLFHQQHNLLLPSSTAAHSHGGGAPVDMAESERQRDILELGEASERSTNEYLKQATGPGVLFGMLRLGSDGDWGGKDENLGLFPPWRYFLDCGDHWEPLTDWSLDEFVSAMNPPIKSGLRIIGAVVGWISANADSSSGLAFGLDDPPATAGG